MNDLPGAVGTAIEGGLLSEAVEGQASTVSKRPSGEEGTCLNCGTTVVGPHCHGCGQKVAVHRSLRAIGHDIMHGVLHLDGKLWRTLPLLAFKPGKLTRRYIAGERAKFVSPMAMFLFSVFLMFAVFQLVGISAPSDIGTTTNLNEAAKAMAEETRDARDDLAARVAAMDADDPDRAEAEEELAQFEKSLTGLAEVQKLEFEDASEVSFSGTGIAAIDEGLLKKWQDNPGLMVYKLQANAYKFSWLLIPLSIPFVWLVFAWKRRFKAYDHAIFVTYSLAFMSLLFIAVSIIGGLGAPTPLIVFSLLLIPPLHLYKHLRGTYDLGRFGAFWRFLFLSVFIWIVIGLFLQMLLLLGAL